MYQNDPWDDYGDDYDRCNDDRNDNVVFFLGILFVDIFDFTDF